MNNINSQLCIEISSVISFAGKEIQQKIYATDLFVYIEGADKQIIYLPKQEAQYLIDTTKKRLTKIDLSAQTSQFEQVKKMIGELSIEERAMEQCKQIHVTNLNPSMIKLNVEMDVVEFTGLEQTVFPKFEEYQSALRPFSVKLKTNEIAVSMESSMIINEQIQTSRMKLLSIKKIENASQFDLYLDFSRA